MILGCHCPSNTNVIKMFDLHLNGQSIVVLMEVNAFCFALVPAWTNSNNSETSHFSFLSFPLCPAFASLSTIMVSDGSHGVILVLAVTSAFVATAKSLSKVAAVAALACCISVVVAVVVSFNHQYHFSSSSSPPPYYD